VKKVYSIGCLLALLVGISGDAFAHKMTAGSGSRAKPVQKRVVKVYLVAVDDNGKTGKKIGCNDSLVAITRTVKLTSSPLKAAIEELLVIPHDYSKQLGNYWWGENLKVKNVSIRKGIATINISGEGPSVAGVCDEPRITSQIDETAKQFPNVKRVKVFVNGRPLAEVIR
jgi:spore germination protein GerM